MAETERPLLIRADASAEIGTGHVMRCLALAQAWQDAGGTAVFAQHACPAGLVARLRNEGVATENVAVAPGSVADVAETAALAASLGAEWVVVDGYAFRADYQEALRTAGLRVLFLDDYGHAERYTADLVLNQNITASPNLYANRTPHTRLLLGTRYVLLRREFWPWQDQRFDEKGSSEEIPAPACRILVTLGGSDPYNVTSTVVQALRHLKVQGGGTAQAFEGVVLIGGSSPHANTVREKAARANLVVLENVEDMPTLLSQTDISVTAGGSTCWEMAFMGVPSLIVVLAENQRESAARLGLKGISVNLGWYEGVTPRHVAEELGTLMENSARRAQMRKRATALVDGQGVHRILSALKTQPSDLTTPHSLGYGILSQPTGRTS